MPSICSDFSWSPKHPFEVHQCFCCACTSISFCWSEHDTFSSTVTIWWSLSSTPSGMASPSMCHLPPSLSGRWSGANTSFVSGQPFLARHCKHLLTTSLITCFMFLNKCNLLLSSSVHDSFDALPEQSFFWRASSTTILLMICLLLCAMFFMMLIPRFITRSFASLVLFLG